MNTRCGMKKKKNTTRWLAILIIVALTISSIVLPGSGVSARADNLDDKTISVENLDEESANKENLTSNTDDKENLNNNITDNNLDSKTTDDKNINTETVDNVNQKSRTVDNEKINNNTSDNSNSESNNAGNNQNINTINNEKIDSNSGNNNQNISTISNGNLDSESVNNSNSNKQSAVNSSISALSEEGIEAYANENNNETIIDSNTKTCTAKLFYVAELAMTSTNKHYLVEGIFIDDNNNANLIIALQTNSTWKHIDSVTVEGHQRSNPPYEVVLPRGTNAKIIITLPNGQTKTLENNTGFLVINLGTVTNLTENFTLSVDTPTGGNEKEEWDIKGATVNITIDDYDITKTASVSTATVGEEITYTVKITNTSDITLTGIEVIDDVPTGLVFTKVNGVQLETPIQTGTVTLAEGVNLQAGESLEYTITAVVSGEVIPNQIKNTATMQSIYIIPKSDDAVVDITNSVTINKIVTGNMG